MDEDSCDGLEGGGCVAVRTGCCGGELESEPLCDTAEEECTPDTAVLYTFEGGGGGRGAGGCSHLPGVTLWPLVTLLVAALLRRRSALLVGVALLALLPLPAAAVDVVRHENLDGSPVPGLIDPSLGQPWTVRASVAGTTALDPVQLRRNFGSVDLVDQIDTLELAGSLQLKDWLVLGFAAPVHRMVVADIGPVHPATDVTAFVRLPLGGDGALSQAAEIRIDTPTRREQAIEDLGGLAGPGGDLSTMFTATQSLSVAWVTAHRTARWWWGTRGGVRLQEVHVLPGVIWGSRWELSGGLRRELGPLGVGGSLRASAPLLLLTRTGQWPAEALMFLAWAPVSGVELQAGVGAGLSRGLGAPGARGVAALDMTSRRKDSDGDGFGDLRDLCPQRAEDRDGWRDSDGCPEADNDRDGLVDADDGCPDEAEVLNGWLDDDGCPDDLAHWTVKVVAGVQLEQVAWAFDGDPEKPGFETERTVHLAPGRHLVQVTTPGFLPEERAIDLDEGETLTEIHLRLLRLGEVHLTLVSDDDGALIDGGTVTADGEPHPVPATGLALQLPGGAQVVEASAPGHLPTTATFEVPPGRSRAVVLRLEPLPPLVERPPVLFDFDSDVLTAAGIDLVEALAAWLSEHPEVHLLRVEGHADAVGGSAYNLDLSQRRAAAVVAALEARGIDRDRLQPLGSGEATAWLSLHAPPPGVDAVVAGHAVREVQFEVLVWDDGVVSEAELPF